MEKLEGNKAQRIVIFSQKIQDNSDWYWFSVFKSLLVLHSSKFHSVLFSYRKRASTCWVDHCENCTPNAKLFFLMSGYSRAMTLKIIWRFLVTSLTQPSENWQMTPAHLYNCFEDIYFFMYIITWLKPKALSCHGFPPWLWNIFLRLKLRK